MEEIYPKLKKIFVISMPRCGTKWLSLLISKRCRSFRSYHEPKPKMHVLSENYFYGKIDKAEVKKQLIEMRSSYFKIADRDGKVGYVECAWQMFLFVDILRELFPSCKIVGLVRDARTFAPSILNMLSARKDIDRYKFKDSWRGLSRYQKAAYMWSCILKYYMKKVDILVKVEDLWGREGWYVFAKISDVTGMPKIRQRTYNNKRKQKLNTTERQLWLKRVTSPSHRKYSAFPDNVPIFTRWSNIHRKQFMNIVKPQLKELKYL